MPPQDTKPAGRKPYTPPPPTPIVPIRPKAVKDDWTLSAIYESNAKSLGELLSGLKYLPGAVAKGFTEIPESAEYIARSFYHDPAGSAGPTWNVVREVLPFLGSTYKDPDTGDQTLGSTAKGAVKNMPIALLDALGLYGMVTGAAKSAALKGASLAKRSGDAQRIALWDQRLATAERWANAPAEIAKSGIAKFEALRPVSALEKGLGISPLARKWAEMAGDEKLRAASGASEDAAALWKAHIPRQLWAKADEILAGDAPLNPAEWTPEQVTRFRETGKLVKAREKALADVGSLKAGGETITDENYEALFEASRVKHSAVRARYDAIAKANGYADKYAMMDDMDKVKRGWFTSEKERQRVHDLEQVLAGEPNEAEMIAAELRRAEVKMAADRLGTGDIARQSYRPFVGSTPMDPGEYFHAVLSPAAGQAQQGASNLRKIAKGGGFKYNPTAVDHNYIQSSRRVESLANIVKRTFAEFGGESGGFLPKDAPIPRGFREVNLPIDQFIDHNRLMLASAQKVVSRNMKGLVEGTPEFAEALKKTIREVGADAVAEGVSLDNLIEKVGKGGRMVLPDEVARALEMELEPLGAFGRIYDNALDMWRHIVLDWSPRFYVNNLIGNAVLQVMYGVSPFQYTTRQMKHLAAEINAAGSHLSERGSGTVPYASRAMEGIRGGQEWLARVTDSQGRGNIVADAAWKAIQERASLSAAADPFKTLESAGMKPAVEAVFKARDTIRQLGLDEMTITSKTPTDIRGLLERSGAMAAKREEFAEMARVADKAIDEMERFTGAYGKATPLARRYLRRVIPFWTFASTMHQLAFWMPLIRPGRSFAFGRMTQMALDAMDDDDLPEYLRGRVWLGADKNGKMLFASVAGFNPFESVGTRRFGGIPVPKLLDPAQGPVVAAVLKGVGAYDQFSHSPPPVQAGQVMDTMGRVWEWDPTTAKAVRVSPQTPILDIAFDLVPQTHVMNDLLAWAGFSTMPGNKTKVFYGPGGVPENPPFWGDALARSMGFPTMRVNVGQARSSYRMQTYRYLRLLAKQAMFEKNPEVRAQTLAFLAESIQDLKASKK